jgi:hypothetical protein
MNEQQFVDRYSELDKQYVKHKQEQYKNYKEPNLPYTEKLFWDKLVNLGWRKDYTTTECLVLVCSVCELSITKVILKDTSDVRGLLNVDERKRHHQMHYCKETGKTEQE